MFLLYFLNCRVQVLRLCLALAQLPHFRAPYLYLHNQFLFSGRLTILTSSHMVTTTPHSMCHRCTNFWATMASLNSHQQAICIYQQLLLESNFLSLNSRLEQTLEIWRTLEFLLDHLSPHLLDMLLPLQWILEAPLEMKILQCLRWRKIISIQLDSWLVHFLIIVFLFHPLLFPDIVYHCSDIMGL